jgi:hypothetical protein
MSRTYQEETDLIAELEGQVCPPLLPRTKENKWSPDNSAYWRHTTAIKDAYWRRRQLSARPGECAPG